MSLYASETFLMPFNGQGMKNQKSSMSTNIKH